MKRTDDSEISYKHDSVSYPFKIWSLNFNLPELSLLATILLIAVWIPGCVPAEKNIPAEKKLFWGDLHNHCDVGYAKGSLGRAYDIAHSHLDFFCFTPHSQWHDQPDDKNLKRFRDAYLRVNKEWDTIQKFANDYYKPGSFVTFIGYEWHSSMYGDNCIIMPGNSAELAYPGNIQELQNLAEKNHALLIPHHPAYMKGYRGQDWQFLGSAEITPVVEIFSEHGNAESDRSPSPYIRHSMGGRYTRNTIQHLWEQGKQVGVVASTDDHLGYPGGYGEGLAAVYADTLTRESVMEAIRARRVYGVSADRIELDFRLNGHFMGESIPYSHSRHIMVKVNGKDVVDRVELLRNDKVIYRNFPVDRKITGSGWDKPVLCRIEFGWGPWSGLNVPRTTDWDFNINIQNGKILSATPCFQAGPFDENRRNIITNVDGKNCRFRSYTSRIDAFEERPVNSIILEIQGHPETELSVSLLQPAVMERRIKLGELSESNDIFFTDDMTSESVIINRIVFYDNYHTEFSLTDRIRTGATDWYYVRVVQANGSLAWSSPVWVNKKTD
jgi:hypothetical protein